MSESQSKPTFRGKSVRIWYWNTLSLEFVEM